MRKRISGLDVYVIFSISAMILYTIVSQIIAVRTGCMLDTLTTCFFGFFGGEIVTCALIKIFKLKEENKLNVSNFINADPDSMLGDTEREDFHG